MAKNTGPTHKLNTSATVERNRWRGSARLHWVSETQWFDDVTQTGSYRTLAAYALFNGNISYSFDGQLSGYEVAIGAYNLADHQHAQILPPDESSPGQSGEILGRQVTVSMSYRFPLP